MQLKNYKKTTLNLYILIQETTIFVSSRETEKNLTQKNLQTIYQKYTFNQFLAELIFLLSV